MGIRWGQDAARRARARRGGADARNDRGVAALEFALVLPILVLLLLGIMEFGMIFGDQLALTHAAREGARLASVGKYDAVTVKNRATPLPAAGITITTYVNGAAGLPSAADRGDAVKVQLDYAYDWTVLPFPGTITLTGSATMRRE